MEALAGMMPKTALEKMPEHLKRTERTSRDFESWQQEMCEIYNGLQGTLDDGFDCDLCKNKGNIQRCCDDGEIVTSPCKCMTKRRVLRNMRRSGLDEVLPRYTFDAFTTAESWQATVKQAALRFAQDDEARCFFIGGQSGSGKTHICTAICGQFIKRLKSVQYALWREMSIALKGNINDDGAYNALIDRYKQVDVLYIDDFFKKRAGQQPTSADVDIAFEIINARYNAAGKKTIISTEFMLPEILDIDEATGGRIFEMSSGEYRLNIIRDSKKNWRLQVVSERNPDAVGGSCRRQEY